MADLQERLLRARLDTARAAAAGFSRSPTSGFPFVAAPSPRGMIEAGNIDLTKRPTVKNADGSISTVRSMSFNADGKEVLVPTVSDDGRIMSDDETIQAYRRTGKHLGIFDTPENATAYAGALHDEQARDYGPASGQGRFLPSSGGALEQRLARARASLESPSRNRPVGMAGFTSPMGLPPAEADLEDRRAMSHALTVYGARRAPESTPVSRVGTAIGEAMAAPFQGHLGLPPDVELQLSSGPLGIVNNAIAVQPAKALDAGLRGVAAVGEGAAAGITQATRELFGRDPANRVSRDLQLLGAVSQMLPAAGVLARVPRTQRVPHADPQSGNARPLRDSGRPPSSGPGTAARPASSSAVPPAPVPFAPRGPTPGLTEPRLTTPVSKSVVDAAGDLLLAGKVQRDPNLLISDQIQGLLQSGRLEAGTIDTVLAKHQVTAPQLAELFRSDIRQAARSMQNLSALERRLNLAAAIETLPESSIGKFLTDAAKPTWRDRLGYLWINALVSGPKTHAANVLSNTMTALWTIPETAVAGAFGAARRALGGTGGVYLGEAAVRTTGLIQGVKDGLTAAARAFMTGVPSDMASKIDIGHRQPLGKPGAWTAGLPTRFLMAEDELFKAIAHRSEINAQALRVARGEGRRGAALAERAADLRVNPTAAMQEAADKFAQYSTFQSELGRFGQALMRVREAVPGSEVVLPFIRTPANILKYATERSPFGLLLREVRTNLWGRNGPAARDTQLARMGLGTAVGVTVASLAAEGRITGSGPQDRRQRALMLANGWQPYSVDIGGKWYAYNRLDPLGLMMGVAADMAEMKGQVDKADADKIGAMVATSISQNLVNKTYLSGLSSMVAAIHDPEQFGESYIRSLAASAVPAGVAQVARTQDPVIRDARTTLDAIMARIPGQSERLPAKLYLFGEPITRPESAGPDLVSPIATSAPRNDAVLDEMIRLDIDRELPQRRIRGVDLTPEQYWDYVARAGKPAKAALNKLVADPGWSRLPDWAKTEAIQTVIDRYRKQAADAMVAAYPDLLRATVEKKLAPVTGAR